MISVGCLASGDERKTNGLGERQRDVGRIPPACASAVADEPATVRRAVDGHVGRTVAVVVAGLRSIRCPSPMGASAVSDEPGVRWTAGRPPYPSSRRRCSRRGPGCRRSCPTGSSCHFGRTRRRPTGGRRRCRWLRRRCSRLGPGCRRWCPTGHLFRFGRTRSRWTAGRPPYPSSRRRCSRLGPGCRRSCPTGWPCHFGRTRRRPTGGRRRCRWRSVAVVVAGDRDVAAGAPLGDLFVSDVPVSPVDGAEDRHIRRPVAVVVANGWCLWVHRHADGGGVGVEAAVVGLVGEAVAALVAGGRDVVELAGAATEAVPWVGWATIA